jgi:hypothetical protein
MSEQPALLAMLPHNLSLVKNKKGVNYGNLYPPAA